MKYIFHNQKYCISSFLKLVYKTKSKSENKKLKNRKHRNNTNLLLLRLAFNENGRSLTHISICILSGCTKKLHIAALRNLTLFLFVICNWGYLHLEILHNAPTFSIKCDTGGEIHDITTWYKTELHLHLLVSTCTAHIQLKTLIHMEYNMALQSSINHISL